MATPIVIKNLTKKFGNVVAVNNVSLTIEPGTFLTLLGPSGCGKTTLLRCISGLEDPDDGEIFIGEKLVFSKSKGISPRSLARMTARGSTLRSIRVMAESRMMVSKPRSKLPP